MKLNKPGRVFVKVDNSYVPQRGDVFDHGISFDDYYVVTKVEDQKFYFRGETKPLAPDIWGLEVKESDYYIKGNVQVLKWHRPKKKLTVIIE